MAAAPKLVVHKPTDFKQVLSIIEDFQSSTPDSWYRGVTQESHGLLPALYRHKKIKTAEKLLELEGKIIRSFAQRSIPFTENVESGPWDQIFFMQHFGVPTRLLDWTQNPLVALFFALNYHPKSKRDRRDAALWLVDPIAWNRAALASISFDGDILDKFSTEIQAFAPGAPKSAMNNYPVMIIGSHNSSRIVAQRGTFCMFGQSIRSMNDAHNDDVFPKACLQKIVIGKDHVGDVRASLLRKGLTESVIFPDLDGLSAEIRRVYGF